MMLSSKKGPAGAGLAVQPPERGRKMGEKMAKRSRWLRPWRAKRHFCKPCAHRRQRVCGREVDMREPEWRTRSHLMAMRVCTSEDCPCSSHNLRYLLYIGEFVLYTRDLVSGTEAEERGRKVEKVLSHGGIRLEPKVMDMDMDMVDMDMDMGSHGLTWAHMPMSVSLCRCANGFDPANLRRAATWHQNVSSLPFPKSDAAPSRQIFSF